jgi:hypothetical protein
LGVGDAGQALGGAEGEGDLELVVDLDQPTRITAERGADAPGVGKLEVYETIPFGRPTAFPVHYLGPIEQG